MDKTDGKKSIRFFKTFRWRMSRSVIAAAAAVIAVMIIIAVPRAEKSLDSVTSDYILNLASGRGHDARMRHKGGRKYVSGP
ncbi:MAG: hypothetical protein ACI4CS_06540 [Candidatus Weimeria sp.]